MAEDYVKNTKYKYDLNASLVQSQRHQDHAGDAAVAGDGSGQTLAGKKLAGFGDRVIHSKPEELQQKALTKLKENKVKAARESLALDQDVLNVKISTDQLLYRPRTRETKQVYEQMLGIVTKLMGDQPLETIRDALDEIIAIVRSDQRDDERKVEIESLVENITESDFNSLNVLGQTLSDYVIPEENPMQAQDEEVQVDPEMNFSDSEQSDFEDVYQIKELEKDQQIDQDANDQKQELSDIEDDEMKLQGVQDYDSGWLLQLLSEIYGQQKSQNELAQIKAQLFELLALESLNARDCEKKVLALIGHKNYSHVRQIMKQRTQMLDQLKPKTAIKTKTKSSSVQVEGDFLKKSQVTESQIKQSAPWLNQTVVDLDKLKFQEAGRLMTNKKCHLPPGATKVQKQGYDEIYVPKIQHRPKADETLIPISNLPQWTHAAFPQEMKTLNLIQSKLYDKAFKSPENILVCAPTGAGKTNIAMLTILQCLESRRRSNNTIDLKSFKIVYVAPMKALVTEVVGNFQRRLASYGIIVRELTGDSHLTRQQIDETQIIVTTPEKWDIVTRKSGERAYTELVKLLIIDEIHLLHDGRGPVLEAIIARTIRQIEQTSELVRIVALSATLPNYQDVAAFLRVKKSGVFYFDNSYRPVPLDQIYIGVSEKKAIKRLILMNEILYEKVIERVSKFQVLVFTHSRKETARTAKLIRDTALQQDHLGKFLKSDSAHKELLLSQVDKCDSQDLKEVLPFGIGIHHAGLTKRDRTMVENLFEQGFLQLLCSTATLAWGVNLPAHTVILKGTQIYSPELGKWVELSPQDVLQMMGRAGRPQYDSEGEGIIITNQTEMQYYLSLNNMQLPIESQLISQLADQMSAEIVLGSISSVKDAVNWISYTYLYVRMLRNPQLYGITSSDLQESDPTLINKRHELVHSAATLLQKSHLIKYDRASGLLQSTAQGKIAAHYYIKCESMQVYAENMKPHMNTIDIFRLFSLSKEFQYIPIRENEKLELIKFVERVPIPVKGSLDEASSKINILLQAYISRFKMDGFDINADTVYVSQNAGRIMRALFEIALKKGWASLSDQLLNLCKICEKRIWNSMTPLRQFPQMPNLEEIAKKLERKVQFQLHHLYELSAQQLGEVVGNQKLGKTIQTFINKFPRLELEAYVQPVTRTLIRIELEIKLHSNFEWDSKYHGTVEPFYVFVHDCDQERILHVEQFILREKTAHDDHKLSFTVLLHDPMPPQYFIKVVSDRWMHCETQLPISFKHLILPDKFPAPTALESMYPKALKDLDFPEVESMFRKDGISEFNSIQSQVFQKVYNSKESVFLGAPLGSDLLTIAELAIFSELRDEDGGKILYIAPQSLICKGVFQNWKKRISQDLGLEVALLDEGQTIVQQLAQINSSDIVVATPKAYDLLSRKWRQRKVLHQITVCIFDYLQLLDAEYEIVVSRCRLIQNELKDQVIQGKSKPRAIRMIGLSCPIANGKDVASWLGVSVDPEEGGYFNFSPSSRPKNLEAVILSFDQFSRTSRFQAMARPAYNSLKRHSESASTEQKSLIFTSDRKNARLIGLDFVAFCTTEENSLQFLGKEIQESILQKLSEQTLITCLQYGIGIIHDGMTEKEIHIVKQLYKDDQIRVLIVTHSYCWEISELKSHVVVVLDVEKYDGVQKRYTEYDIPSILQMQSQASMELVSKEGVRISPKFHLMVYSARRDYFVKFLQEPMPLESQITEKLHDAINCEVANGTITNKQEAVDWLTWTFMFRRLSPNPNYYNLSSRTPQSLNDFISQLIEDTVEDLVESKCIQVDEENEFDLTPQNIGRIAAFYNVSYKTISLFAKHLDDEKVLSQKMKALLQVLTQAAEFEHLQIREGEEPLLASIAQYQTYPQPQQAELNAAPQKASVLLQAHFDRKPLPVDLGLDQKYVLGQVLTLIHAMTDVTSTNEHLNATLLCMEMSQMCVQAMWPRQSPLLQLPGFDDELVDTLKQNQVIDITDFMNMDDDLRAEILKVDSKQMEKLAAVCNRYPVVEMRCETDKKAYSPGDQVTLQVAISRAEDDEDSLSAFEQPVFAPYFPSKRFEDWWLVVGQPKQGKLLAIKKITGFRATAKATTELKFSLQSGGEMIQDGFSVANLRVFLICDSYVGADLQEELKIKFSC